MRPSPILLPFSYLYGIVMAVRNAFFENQLVRTERIRIPVISVGNMTAGGTGKTPLVEHLAQLLTARGVTPAIVSRGYGRRSTGLVVVSDGRRVRAEAERSGDEPQQLAQALPGVIVIVDEDRVRGARYAQDVLEARAVILDDGFQHRRLGRTLDIVVLDREQDLFRMAMLPAGLRREPLASLARADAFVITKCAGLAEAGNLVKEVRAYNAKAPVLTSSYAPESVVDARTGEESPCTSVAGMKAVAFCGIGRPESFRRTCDTLGVRVGGFYPFADHHRYDEGDYRMLGKAAREAHADMLLTTEKDARRIGRTFAPAMPLRFVKMRARINEPAAMDAMLNALPVG